MQRKSYELSCEKRRVNTVCPLGTKQRHIYDYHQILTNFLHKNALNWLSHCALSDVPQCSSGSTYRLLVSCKHQFCIRRYFRGSSSELPTPPREKHYLIIQMHFFSCDVHEVEGISSLALEEGISINCLRQLFHVMNIRRKGSNERKIDRYVLH